jgi:hypothetical protein
VSAKHKLNAAAFNGAMLFAMLAGGLTGSWGVFLIVLALMVISAMAARDIRR